MGTESAVWEAAEAVRASLGIRFGTIELVIQDGRVTAMKRHVTDKPDDQGEVQLRG